MVARPIPYERPQPTPTPTDGCGRGGLSPTTEPGPGGWVRLAIAVLGPPAAWGAGYVADTYVDLGPPHDSWLGTYVGGPLWGLLMLALGLFLAMVTLTVVGGAVLGLGFWVREGFQVDAQRAALRAPDRPGVGQLSAPEGGELSMPETERARVRR